MVGLEVGTQNKNAHLQSGWLLTVEEDWNAGTVIAWWKDILNPLLRKAIEDVGETAFVNVMWAEPHEHADKRLLWGYCFKESKKEYFRMANIGLPSDNYLESAFLHYMQTKAKDVHGESASKIARPGATKDENVITKGTLVSNAEYVEYIHDWQAMNLTIAKLTSLDVSSGRSTVHPMFVTPQHNELASAARINAFLLMRRSPRLAADINLMKLVLHGDEWRQGDNAVEQLMVQHGPSPSITDDMSIDDINESVRTGLLPNGDLVQGALRGYIGQGIVIDLDGSSDAMAFVQEATNLELLVKVRMHKLPGPADICRYRAAAGARLLLSQTHPFALSEHDVIARLNHPSLVGTMNRMLGHNESATRRLTGDEMTSLLSSIVVHGDEIEHPWLKEGCVQPLTGVAEGVLTQGQALGDLRTDLAEHQDGAPQVRVRMIRTASGGHYVAAWQVSTAHNYSLRPPPRAAASSAHAPEPATTAGTAPLAQGAGAPVAHATGRPASGAGTAAPVAHATLRPVPASGANAPSLAPVAQTMVREPAIAPPPHTTAMQARMAEALPDLQRRP